MGLLRTLVADLGCKPWFNLVQLPPAAPMCTLPTRHRSSLPVQRAGCGGPAGGVQGGAAVWVSLARIIRLHPGVGLGWVWGRLQWFECPPAGPCPVALVYSRPSAMSKAKCEHPSFSLAGGRRARGAVVWHWLPVPQRLQLLPCGPPILRGTQTTSTSGPCTWRPRAMRCTPARLLASAMPHPCPAARVRHAPPLPHACHRCPRLSPPGHQLWPQPPAQSGAKGLGCCSSGVARCLATAPSVAGGSWCGPHLHALPNRTPPLPSLSSLTAPQQSRTTNTAPRPCPTASSSSCERGPPSGRVGL